MPLKTAPPKKARRARTEAELERYAYSFILEALTQGLYPNVFHVLREYIQNAYDAIIRHMVSYHNQDYKVKINITGNSVFIADNGVGMTLDKIKQYRLIGYSEKKLGEEAGFRGIGKIAGLSVAERLVVTSKAQGQSQRYTLSFDAREMLEEIVLLKAQGTNRPFDDLMRDHTTLESASDDPDAHYTVVELNQVRPEFAALLDLSQVRDFVSSVAPVPLSPQFQYEDEINRWLVGRVSDYSFFPHLVNDEPIYKPFTNETLAPQFLVVETKEGSEQAIAYAWSCGNATESQFPQPGPRGLVFRMKNIAIGSSDLVRTMLWESSGHLAYWYFGEIHIIDPAVIPTAERSNFEDNKARQRLVQRARADVIAALNRDARERSGRANAEKRLEELKVLVKDTRTALKRSDVRREEVVYEAAKLVNTMDKTKKSKGRLPAKRRAEADKAIANAKALVNTFEKVTASPRAVTIKGVIDIKEQLQLSNAEWKLYDLMDDFLRDHFVDDEAGYLAAIRGLQDRMLRYYAQ